MRKGVAIAAKAVLIVMTVVWTLLAASALAALKDGTQSARAEIFHLFRSSDVFESTAIVQRRIIQGLLIYAAITVITIFIHAWAQSDSHRS